MLGWIRLRLGAGALGATLGAWALGVGCSSAGHPRALSEGTGGDSGDGGSGGTAAGGGGSAASGGVQLDTGLDGPPPVDAAGYCGNTFIPVQFDRPNLYFILDRSGSMDLSITGSSESRYHAALSAIDLMLIAIGHRVNYGAAVFPSPGGQGCNPGLEVFSTRLGDPTPGVQGTILTSLMVTLQQYAPSGEGTPTSSSIAAVTPTLTSLGGHTVAVLATDGAPNCNVAASCDASHCQRNIELYGGCSPLTPNCCLPPTGQYDCIDDGATTTAIADLLAGGVKTYVVGMPGTTATGGGIYGAVLDAMAVAGGTARSTSPKYYPTTSGQELTDTLTKIGVDVAVSCDVALGSAPPNKKLVAVYFDKSRVKEDDVNGWTWTGDATLQLRGTACDQLKSGAVGAVQVVADCPISAP